MNDKNRRLHVKSVKGQNRVRELIRAARRGFKAEFHAPKAVEILIVTHNMPNAVIRNRVRRRIRDAVRALSRDGGVREGVYVLRGHPEDAALSWERLKSEVLSSIRKQTVDRGS